MWSIPSYFLLLYVFILSSPMDLSGSPGSGYSDIMYIVEGLQLLLSNRATGLVISDLPPEFFSLFENHEVDMLRSMKKVYNSDQSVISFRREGTLPIGDIMDMGLLQPCTPEQFRLSRNANRLFVHCQNFLEYDPGLTRSQQLLQRTNMVYKMASAIFKKTKQEILAPTLSEEPVFEVFVSGHLLGTAAAQLVAISLECDEELALIRKGIEVYSVGFGEYRIFSPKMIESIRELFGFDMKKHIVFASVERYFSPNFNSSSRFGTVMDLDLNSIFSDNSHELMNILDRILKFNGNEVLSTAILSGLVEKAASESIFAAKAQPLLGHEETSKYLNEQIDIDAISQELFGNTPDATVRQQVFAASLAHLYKMFQKYYVCLKKPAYYLNIVINGAHEDISFPYNCYHDITVHFMSRMASKSISFNFRVYPWQPKDEYWPTMGMFKVKRFTSSSFSVHPEEKFRSRYSNWANFFQKQWARLSGLGVSAMKSLSPFFEDSIFFNIGIKDSYIALIADPEALMDIFLCEDAETIRLVQDVFGPLKSPCYLHFSDAQRLIRSPYVAPPSQSVLSYLLPPSGSLIDVVKKLFSDNEFSLQSLVLQPNPLLEGFKVVSVVTSFEHERLVTKVNSREVAKKMSKDQFLHVCNQQIPGKHCPYLSLRTPNNPFWKRIIRVQDIYISFLGASAVHLGGYVTTKYDMIMEHLGEQAGPFEYAKVGSFIVLEMYSSLLGFGPCSQQTTFYLLLIQDPRT